MKQKKLAPLKPYTLTVESSRHNTGVGYETYLTDQTGARYFTTSGRVSCCMTRNGDTVTLEARIKSRSRGVKTLWYIRDVEIIPAV